jgi:mono/diheme cytochrome c family protein
MAHRTLTLATLLALLAAPLQAADGAAVYVNAKCAVCHGAKGDAQTPMGKKLGIKDLGSVEVQKRTDADIEKLVVNGKGKMPGFKKLSADEMKTLIAHLRAFAKK